MIKLVLSISLEIQLFLSSQAHEVELDLLAYVTKY